MWFDVAQFVVTIKIVLNETELTSSNEKTKEKKIVSLNWFFYSKLI